MISANAERNVVPFKRFSFIPYPETGVRLFIFICGISNIMLNTIIMMDNGIKMYEILPIALIPHKAPKIAAIPEIKTIIPIGVLGSNIIFTDSG